MFPMNHAGKVGAIALAGVFGLSVPFALAERWVHPLVQQCVGVIVLALLGVAIFYAYEWIVTS